MSDDLFTAYERLETARRVEVTLENLHLLARHFDGTAAYGGDPEGGWLRTKPHLIIPRGESRPARAEVGSWIDQKGNRWNPDPVSQGWEPAGTYRKVDPTP